jgi:hypothetical protein
MDHAFGRGFEDSSRETLIADCPRQDQRACHGSEGRDRVVIAAGTAGPPHQPGQEIEPFFQFRCEGIANSLRLFGDLAAQRRCQAAFAGGIAVIRDRYPATMAGNAFPRPLRSSRRRQRRLEPAITSRIASARWLPWIRTGCRRHRESNRRLRDCVNPGGAGAAFAKQAGGRGQYLQVICAPVGVMINIRRSAFRSFR